MVSCAKQVFADNGYHAATISQIVQCAGIARSTFYQYFDSKQHLLQNILDSFLQDLQGSVKPISLSPGAPGPIFQIQDNLTRVLELVLGERDLTRILLHRRGSLHDSVEQRLRQFYDDAAEMIERSLELGINMNLVRPCDTRLTSYSVIGAVKEVVFQLTNSQQPQPAVDQLVRGLVEFGMRGILVPSQADSLEAGGWNTGVAVTSTSFKAKD